ncbi:UNVERIFIED_CONTAM: hypothetical protein FKN15_014740 [Acipenser sinensis]
MLRPGITLPSECNPSEVIHTFKNSLFVSNLTQLNVKSTAVLCCKQLSLSSVAFSLHVVFPPTNLNSLLFGKHRSQFPLLHPAELFMELVSSELHSLVLPIQVRIKTAAFCFNSISYRSSFLHDFSFLYSCSIAPTELLP